MSLANLLPPPHHSVFNPCHVISLDCSCIPILHLDHFALHSSILGWTMCWINHPMHPTRFFSTFLLDFTWTTFVCGSASNPMFFPCRPTKARKMEVSSWNRVPQSHLFQWDFPLYINHRFWGTNIYGNPQIDHKNRRAAYSCIPNMRLSTFHSPVGLIFDDKLIYSLTGEWFDYCATFHSWWLTPNNLWHTWIIVFRWSIHLLLPKIPLNTCFQTAFLFQTSIPNLLLNSRIPQFSRKKNCFFPAISPSCSFMRFAGMERTPMATNLALTAAQVSVKGSSTVTLVMLSSPSTTETSTMILMGESPEPKAFWKKKVGWGWWW